MTTLTLVLAMAENGVIGDKGMIPWHIPEDLRRFKALTMGKPIIMGRKTWDSFPKKPLPGRTNIVITRQPGWQGEGAHAVSSLADALALAKAENPPSIMVIGGAQIYALALPLADKIEMTLVGASIAGDTVMPPFEPGVWRETACEDRQGPDGFAYAYVTLLRRRAPQ
jgi:dihydrofolate reductase